MALQVDVEDLGEVALPEGEAYWQAVAQRAFVGACEDGRLAGESSWDSQQAWCLSLRWLGMEQVRVLNRDFRGHDRATNVLSFPAGELPVAVVPRPLGDVAIASEVVRREALEQGKPFVAHAAHMVVHGVLHCMGYDHQDDEQARRMEGLERRVLAELGFENPYVVS